MATRRSTIGGRAHAKLVAKKEREAREAKIERDRMMDQRVREKEAAAHRDKIAEKKRELEELQREGRQKPLPTGKRTFEVRTPARGGFAPGSFTGPIVDTPETQVQPTQPQEAQIDPIELQQAQQKREYLDILQTNPKGLHEFDYRNILNLALTDKNFGNVARGLLTNVADEKLLDFQRASLVADGEESDVSPSLLTVTGKNREMTELLNKQEQAINMTEMLQRRYSGEDAESLQKIRDAVYLETYSPGRGFLANTVKEITGKIPIELLNEVMTVNGWTNTRQGRAIKRAFRLDPQRALGLAMKKNTSKSKRGSLPFFADVQDPTDTEKEMSKYIKGLSKKNFFEELIDLDTNDQQMFLTDWQLSLAEITKNNPGIDPGVLQGSVASIMPSIVEQYQKAKDQIGLGFDMSSAIIDELPADLVLSGGSTIDLPSLVQIREESFMDAVNSWGSSKSGRFKNTKTYEQLKERGFVDRFLRDDEFRQFYLKALQAGEQEQKVATTPETEQAAFQEPIEKTPTQRLLSLLFQQKKEPFSL